MFSPRHFQSDELEKLTCGDESIDALRRHLSLLQKVDFILADRLQVEFFRTEVVVFCEFGDVVEVTSLCGGCEATQAGGALAPSASCRVPVAR
jgi:hypothetical protein